MVPVLDEMFLFEETLNCCIGSNRGTDGQAIA